MEGSMESVVLFKLNTLSPGLGSFTPSIKTFHGIKPAYERNDSLHII